MATKSYLVTGGTGFLGSHLVKALIRQGHTVRVFDNDSRGNVRRLSDVQGCFELVGGDIRQHSEVMKACANIDCIVHMAYVNGTATFYKCPDLVLDVAVRGMLNILDACQQHQVPELFLASSSEVYQTPPQVPTPEDVPLVVPNPHNPRYSYGGGKIISELLALHNASAQRVVIFRPHNVYGSDMEPGHVIPDLCLKMRRLHLEQPHGPLTVPIQGSGLETRSFIHIDDFIAALCLLLEKGEHQNIYHVGTEEEISISDLLKLLNQNFYGREIKIVPSQPPQGETPRRRPSVSKLAALGFSPQVPLAAGLQETASWYHANGYRFENRKTA